MPFALIHLWLGPITIFIGILDGGVGFSYADTFVGPTWAAGWKIAYGVVGGVVWLTYVGVCIVWVELKKVPRAAPISPGAPPEEMTWLADAEVKERETGLLKERSKTNETQVTTSQVGESDDESVPAGCFHSRKRSRTGVWV
jgi:hypothetical protein